MRVALPPCGNCGKRQGYTSSSTWGHNALCCSDACGVRLGARIRNGMATEPMSFGFGSCFLQSGYDNSLRIRIKQLEHRLKEALKNEA